MNTKYKLPVAELTRNQYGAIFLGLGRVLASTLEVAEVVELARLMQDTYDVLYNEAIKEIGDKLVNKELDSIFTLPTKKERMH